MLEKSKIKENIRKISNSLESLCQATYLDMDNKDLVTLYLKKQSAKLEERLKESMGDNYASYKIAMDDARILYGCDHQCYSESNQYEKCIKCVGILEESSYLYIDSIA